MEKITFNIAYSERDFVHKYTMECKRKRAYNVGVGDARRLRICYEVQVMDKMVPAFIKELIIRGARSILVHRK